MKKFEYGEMVVTIGGPITGTKAEFYYFKPGGEHSVRKGTQADLMTLLGEDGWQVVGSSARTETGLGGKHKINYIFMREKES